MNITTTLRLSLLLCLFVGLASCGGDGDTMLDATIVTKGGTVSIIKSHSIPLNAPGDDPTEAVFVFGNFGPSGVDAGTLTVNGDDVTQTVSHNGIVSYNSTNSAQTFPNVKFDGSTHTVAVSGAGSIPAVSLIVKSPEDFTVTAPASGPVFNRAQDLPVSWTGGSASASDSISISLSPDGSNTNAYIVPALPNNGSFTIPAKQLESFGDTVVIIVSRYRRASTTVSSKSFTATSEVRWAYPILLQ